MLRVALLAALILRTGRGFSRRLRPCSRVTRRRLFDHFVDCQQFPEIGALYGPGSSVCLGGQPGLGLLLSGGLSQLASFALLLTSYYALKRGASVFGDLGVSDSEEPAAGGERRCPKCNGSGVFTWGRDGLSECDLCDGSGAVLAPSRAPLELPGAASRRLIDQEDEEDI